MKRIVLPPKRWEKATSSIFDPIRHKPWFPRLLKRKHHIPALENAHRMLMDNLTMPQKLAAGCYGLDERELRDYIKFKHNQNPEITKIAQKVIDLAYRTYCLNSASNSWRRFLDNAAAWYGVKPRPIIELWEVCPNYYPTNYERPVED